MIGDHFWKTVLALFLLAGLGFWFHNYQKNRAFGGLTMDLAELISFTDDTMPADEEEAQQRFIKAFTLIHNSREEGEDPGLMFDSAFKYNETSTSGSKASLIRRAIYAAEAQGKKLGIFNEESIWDLQDGQLVKIVEGPFSGEKIAILRSVPASIAKRAEFFIGNFVLVPESVAAVSQDLVITENLYNASSELAAAEVITPATAKLIKTQYYKHRNRTN